ncbi:nucleotidyltransferase family protein [Bacillus sp. JJ1566]|uniref:nucleotidyltransferase family protein n=1 Tax=Bacillus sp. JJ1566 TaxID=3122961 RepID=UPI002FFD7D9E
MQNIGAIILAAGQSSRFGQMKQLIHLGNKPLFLYSVELALKLKLKPIIIVGNEKTNEMKELVENLNVTYIENDNYKQGMSSSLKEGIFALANEKQNPNAVMVFLADQPFIPLEVIRIIYETYERQYASGIRIVRPRYRGEVGHPVLFDASVFNDLTEIEGDQGARKIIKSNPEIVTVVDFMVKEWNLDIDKPEDYEHAKQYLMLSLINKKGK